MAKQTINIGTVANDGTGDPLRTAFNKANENFTEVYDIAQGAYDYANTIVSDTQVDPVARSIANSAFDAANAIVTFDQDLNTSNNVTFNEITVSSNLVITETTSLTKTVEVFSSIADATGVVTHDCSTGQIFNHTSIDDNFTANFTNLNLGSGKATTITLVLNQGGTAYIANAVQIQTSAQTIKWSANTVPTGNTNAVDVVSFSIFNNSGTYTVLGQLSTFG